MWQHRFDLVAHLIRQWSWSEKTFGPGPRTKGVIDHIRKELVEVEANPRDLSEWIDIMILAADGALREGFTPHEIALALEAKQTKNEGRKWPDWRTAAPDKAIEHVREEKLYTHRHEMQVDLEEGVPARCRVAGCDYSE
jgi:hypothetical protein